MTMDPTGVLQISSRSQALANARREIRKYIPVEQDLVEELIRDRQTDTRRDDEAT